MAGRRFTRPRTRVYDCNYNLGETYYKPAIDGLDRKYGSLPQETIEAPRRPVSVGNFESLFDDRRSEANSDAINSQIEEEIQSMRRMAKARAREPPTAEADFENAFLQRREEVKKRFSDKILDSVGINGNALEEESASLRRRFQRAAASSDEEKGKLPIQKWSALKDSAEETFDEIAAKSRARISRARLADIENEMEELAEKSAARDRRLAGLRDLLSDSTQSDASSFRLRKKVTVSTTEKRVM